MKIKGAEGSEITNTDALSQYQMDKFPSSALVFSAVIDRDGLGCGVARDITAEIDMKIMAIESFGDKERAWVYITNKELDFEERGK